MKKLIFTFIGFLIIGSSAVFAKVDTVEIVDNEFIPETIEITAGDTILWIQNATVVHTTTSGSGCTADGNWDSGNMDPGDEFTHEFTTPGEYPYYCIPHCSVGMTGHVTVNDVGSGTDQPDNEVTVEVYPNPVTDQIKVTIDQNNLSDVEYEIFDLRGSRVLGNNIPNGEKTWTVNTSALKSGMYILKIRVDGRMLTVRKIHKI